ncbi:MAG: TIR domain-containing protein [Sphingopyxis sp.]|uniref:TIR domain-containing protein n=1 Tax=Sphingopyxis sp. TaxID=1908224 RepID=UPI002ABC47BC|nr:TIR domain-containing protein [Sphingopyxis sp.]MDZ3833361.1 TIR domain-containing protein [Sphingopyxis sp.]
MAYRNKTYIAFDGDNDMRYYRLMTAWAANEKFDFSFYDAHDINSARDTSQEESIKRQLRERFANSKAFIVLIGDNTRFLTKFVKWEIETAIKLGLPIIAVNLNKGKRQDALCPPSLKQALAIYVPFSEKMIGYALENWPATDVAQRKAGKSGAFHYNDSVYRSLGVT